MSENNGAETADMLASKRSADVQSIAIKLAELTGLVERMADSPTHEPTAGKHGSGSDDCSIEAPLEATNHSLKDLVTGLYKSRRVRDKHINPDLFGEPAWDLLLDIYYHQIIGRAVSVTDACLGSCVPNTTALRWITVLLEEGLIARVDDPADRRRGFLRLSDSGIVAMNKTLLATQGLLASEKPQPKIWKI